MSKLINSINHLRALILAFPNSKNYDAWNKKYKELLAELRDLIRARNEAGTAIPFINAVTLTDEGLFLLGVLIFSFSFDEIDETDPPSQPKYDLMDDLVAELKKENISESEKRVLDDWLSTYKTRVNDWIAENSPSP